MSPNLPQWIFILSVMLTGCASLKQPTDDPTTPSSAIASQPVLTLHCHEPEYLVRDLTVPWGTHRYVIGPCDGDLLHRGALPATGMLPAIPPAN